MFSSFHGMWDITAQCNLLVILEPSPASTFPKTPQIPSNLNPDSPAQSTLHLLSMDLTTNRGLNLLLNFLLIVVALLLMLILVKLMWPSSDRQNDQGSE